MISKRLQRLIVLAIILEVPALTAVYYGVARPLSGNHGDALTGSAMMTMGFVMGWLFLELRRSGLLTDRLLFWGIECQLGFGMFLGGLGLATLESRHFYVLGWIACSVFILAVLAASVIFLLAVFRLGRAGKARTPPNGERGYNSLLEDGEKKNEER